MTLDVEALRQWVGRQQEASDRITPHLVKAFRALLDQEPGEPREGEPAPLAIHWCLAPAIAPQSALGPDGHPARGGFLPPVPLPRRMWAGGTIEWLDGLRVGDEVRRRSTVEAVEAKQGRSGALCFVTVRHRFETPRGPALEERHDIVYRDLVAGAAAPTYPAGEAQMTRTVEPTPTLLFRYSAVTYNGHRIHYDRPYATGEEGYPGLVVHGPLQSTLMQHLARDLKDGLAPRRCAYRGISPLFDGAPFTVRGRLLPDGGAECWTEAADGRVAMTLTAGW